MNLVDIINKKLLKTKTKSEMIQEESLLAKELVYSMKVNFWMHDEPQRIRLTKLQPMFKGMREQVFN